MSARFLYNELRGTNPDLADELDAICREALEIWDEQYLRPFTAHGKPHIEQVERNLDSLTRPLQSLGATLTAEEIFVLLSACYLHDIGMQLDDPDARAKHAEYAHSLILYSHALIGPEERRVTLPINDTNGRIAIALVARGHWTQYALQLKSEDFIVGNKRGRLRLLGVLLAMADLLDLSPVRARYFRSIHRLYDLKPLSELHQKMHALVKGFQILAPKPEVSGDLQFQLEWHDNSETVHDISDWIMKWINSQWRQLHEPLYMESRGTIRWAKPWATIFFNIPPGPVQTLSVKALDVLKAERAEQARIDRDKFIERFKDSIISGEAMVFLFPRNSGLDGRVISEWCESHARLYKNCLIARVDVQPHDPLDLSSIISQLMEQWGKHLPVCRDDEALEHLRSFVSTDQTALISVIVSEEYKKNLLETLLQTLVQRPHTSPNPARICLLLTHEATGPNNLNNASIIPFDGLVFSEIDVKQHLQAWGYSENECRDIYRKISNLGIKEKPGMIYTYIENHCGLLN